MLNSFERSGWVKLSRGAIDIRDVSALSTLVGGKRNKARGRTTDKRGITDRSIALSIVILPNKVRQ